MEAKDTVMTTKQAVECSHNPVEELRVRAICEAQAEISFKAGFDEGVKLTTDACDSTFGTLLEEAKVRGLEAGKVLERKRVLGILQKEYPAIDTWQCWQGLKEGK